MIIQLSCADRPGIVSRITGIISNVGGNILSLEQHVESDKNLYFMRVVVDDDSFNHSRHQYISTLEAEGEKLEAQLSIIDDSIPMNVAIFVTKEAAPLYDLLIKHQAGELHCHIPLIISNHADLESIASQFNIPFSHFNIQPNNKVDQEKEIQRILDSNNIDLLVLARYMQILSPEFVKNNISINIHHGFLPAFKGNRPYHQAWKRGVKIIGATAHYVTEELDEGPIIAQDVVSVTHHHSVKDMIQAGRDIERRVLTSAVKAHLEHRIILHNQRTIIFH